MRTMIAVPCMDMVHTLFFASFVAMNKPEGTEVAIASCSLIYEARHTLAKKAMDDGFDRVMWLDSDMVFEPDLMNRLSADLDQGLDFVSAVYFSRKNPISPIVYETCHPTKLKNGDLYPTVESFREIPEELFEIEGCGFGAAMMTTDLIRRAGPLPFYPTDKYGEDLSFCRKAREAGAKLYCDGRIRLGHIGSTIINEESWRKAKGGKA